MTSTLSVEVKDVKMRIVKKGKCQVAYDSSDFFARVDQGGRRIRKQQAYSGGTIPDTEVF